MAVSPASLEPGAASPAAVSSPPDTPSAALASAEPAAAPSEGAVSDPTLARVRFVGVRQAWLERGGEQLAPGAVPAGTYTVTVYFEGVDPVSVGTFEFKAGEERLLTCSSPLRSCR